MSLTQRGRVVVTVGAVVALLAVVGVALAVSGANTPFTSALQRLTGQSTSPSLPPQCPLTGVPAHGGTVPSRPVLAVKVENTAAAYPLAGLDKADIVYEELVEGGITRFMVLYQCQDTSRVGPVRSARTTDPRVLRQYDAHPLIAYSGGQKAVVNLVNARGLVGLTETSASGAFRRDPARAVPHNLFVNTQAAFMAGKKMAGKAGAPTAVFGYSMSVPKGKRIRSAQIRFSFSATAQWSWSGGRWVRMMGGVPMRLESGVPITADNVLIQQVAVTQGSLVDVLGNHSPEVTLVGTGRAWLLRDGVLVAGKWHRTSYRSPTVFVTRKGVVFLLKPGVTWVELAPRGEPVTFTR